MMLTEPQRNSENGEEVKAGISSQVFVGFEQTARFDNGEGGSERMHVCESTSARSLSFSL